MGYSTKEVTDRLRISRERVEQWISRGIFVTSHKPGPGLPREWELEDAIRLMATVELAETALPAAMAAHFGKYAAWGPHVKGSFLVLKFRPDESIVSAIVTRDEFVESLSGSLKATVLNLDELRERVIRHLEGK